MLWPFSLHKKLVKGYFRNAQFLLRPFGEIHVSHKTGDPYDKWGLERIAAKFSLILVEKVGFQKADYPGYNQKKGGGPKCDKPFPLGTCFTFKFRIGDLEKWKKQNGKGLSMPGPSLNALGAPVGIPPLLGGITSTTLLTPQGHPWYEQRIIAEPLGGTTDYFSREYQGSLQRESEMLRQVMPGGTSLSYSVFLENRFWESVQMQEHQRWMIAYSCQWRTFIEGSSLGFWRSMCICEADCSSRGTWHPQICYVRYDHKCFVYR